MKNIYSLFGPQSHAHTLGGGGTIILEFSARRCPPALCPYGGAAHCLTGLTSSLAELIKSFKVREVGQISSEHLSSCRESVPHWARSPLAHNQWLH